MGPISIFSELPQWLDLLIAFLIGTGFGFALEQAGFSSSRKLAGMFYGYDTTVLKVFFTAAIVALLGSQVLSFLGLLNLNMVFVNHYYLGATLIGGTIMGAGFIMGGFCPGTGISALAIGKIDAMIFLLGGLFGAYLFAETYPFIQPLAMGSYKGPLKIDEWMGISSGAFTLLLIVVAVGLFWLAELAEKKFDRPDIRSEL
ncbi:YeeE/YedE thiosulfate transporter family protein [uncultured Draconibacterium sp.]|uniref:YeeE/YedE thiosulfate transporter family protein n=1 Tax=uncultured Draconibacterium sp. TaxID=1573823 RepID=UPI0032172212